MKKSNNIKQHRKLHESKANPSYPNLQNKRINMKKK